jgi:hypothetical protein
MMDSDWKKIENIKDAIAKQLYTNTRVVTPPARTLYIHIRAPVGNVMRREVVQHNQLNIDFSK